MTKKTRKTEQITQNCVEEELLLREFKQFLDLSQEKAEMIWKRVYGEYANEKVKREV